MQVNNTHAELNLQQPRNHHAHANHRVLHKMDRIFYNCVRGIKKKYKWWIIFDALKTLLIIGLIPVDYYTLDGFKDVRMFIQFVIAAVASFAQVVMRIFYFKLIMNNSLLLLKISQNLDHSTQQLITADLKEIKNCVSLRQYNHQNHTLVSQHYYNDVNQTREKQLTSSIKQQTHKKYRCIYIGKKFADVLGLLSMFYTLYVLMSGLGTNWLQILVMYCEFMIEFMAQLLLLAIFLFIVFFPFILIVLAIKCCANNCKCEQGWWRFKPNGQNRVLPDEKKITQSMIEECDGLCTICLQQFNVDDQVIVLKCSPKHIFHPECIQAWMEYRRTCPNCRLPIKAN